MDIRRVVTGSTPAGAAVVADERIEPITVGLMPGAEFHAIWGSDTRPSLPADGGAVIVSAARTPIAKQAGGLAGFTAMDLGGFAIKAALERAGISGDTVDYVVILSGELWLELDNGQQHVLRAGDTIVQNGTRHAWRNKSEHPCVMALALIGAARQH